MSEKPQGPIRTGPYPELTATGILVGWGIGVVIAVSIAYAALILGFSIEGSELAAILGWGILRGILRRSSIVENNINQTIASAVNGASSGIMFSVPALFVMSRSDKFASFAELDWSMIILIVAACIVGCVLGLAFVIPLRKQMIDFDRLAYPGGIAVATILKSPGAGIRKAVLLLVGALVSAAFAIGLFATLGEDHDWHLGKQMGWWSVLNITFYLSLMTVGVGFLSGKGGFWFGAGGFICYFILGPAIAMFGGEGDNSATKVTDPVVRTALVSPESKGDKQLLTQTYNELKELESDSAQEFSDKTGLTAVMEKEKESGESGNETSDENEQNESKKQPDSDRGPPSFETALNAEVAALIVKAEKEIKAAADGLDEGDPDESEKKTKLTNLAKKLESTFTAEKILSSIDHLNAASEETRKTLYESTTSFELWQNIKQSDLPDEAKTDLLAATKAESTYYGVPSGLRLGLFRPLGIGMLIGAALGGIIMAFPLIRSAFKSMNTAGKGSGDVRIKSDEMPIKFLYAMIVVGGLIMIGIAFMSAPEKMNWMTAILMAALGTVWVWVAGVIVAECIGRTNWSPLSGMTLIAVTILIVIAKTGLPDVEAVLSSIVVGAAICLAISQASDMMLDLKSGYLIGAVPRRQQIAQFIGAWLGPIVVIGLMIVLDQKYEIGSNRLPAPQATALATTVEGIVDGNVPTYRYVAGGGLGLLLATSGLGGIGVLIALGFYMPFAIVLTYTIGNILRVLSDKFCGKNFSHEVGIPIAAGLIVGEALVGVGNAIVQVFFG